MRISSLDQYQVHRPAPKPILGLRRPPGRQRNLVALAAHRGRRTTTLPPWKPIFPLCLTPAVANAISAAMAWTGKPLRVLAQHLHNRSDAGRQTEAIE